MEELYRQIDAMEGEMAKALCRLVEIPAISPASGGEGERAKAMAIAEIVCEMGLPSPERYDAPSPGGVRPNLVVTLEGTKRRLWIVTHGRRAGGRSPMGHGSVQGLIKDGKVFGRGANDNGQELVASLYALYALKRSGVTPARDICLAFVADEEMGSAWHSASDFPGALQTGRSRGCARRGTKEGLHRSRRESDIVARILRLGETSPCQPPGGRLNASAWQTNSPLRSTRHIGALSGGGPAVFAPASTFEPTRRRANVSNVNTIPGREIFAFDCRILPSAGMKRF